MLDFIETELYPREAELGEGPNSAAWQVHMEVLQREAKRRGLWALGHPEDIGGGGLSFMDYTYINEAIGRSLFGLFAVGTSSFQDSLLLHDWASEEIKDRYLGPLVAGEILPSFSMTEPAVGSSDPTQLATTAELVGDEWVINGTKWFTGRAHRSAFALVMARTEPGVEGRRAYSMLLVPTDNPGFEIERSVLAMGFDGDHCVVHYRNARVPASHLVGPRGAGFVLSQKRLGPGRISHCMRWLGQAQRAYELMCDRAVTRVVFGSRLSDKQLIQEMVFQTACEIKAHRLMTLAAAEQLDRGDAARVDIGMIKVVGASMLHHAIDRAIQVWGGAGVTDDLPLEAMYRQARWARLVDGADEVHKVTVARLLLEPFRAAAEGPGSVEGLGSRA
jgi:alkylation response protein AidB-like acyl-CoA dehydrogenase